MKLIIDAQTLDLYKGWRNGGFFGGSETMVNELASGLAGKGHTVHVVCPDGDDEQRADRLFYWGPRNHPTKADAVICVPNIEHIDPYAADLLIVATNGIGHFLGVGDEVNAIDAFPVFSQTHADLLASHQGVKPEKCHITGLGVDKHEYDHICDQLPGNELLKGSHLDCFARWKVPGRIMVGNDPQRGLWHVLDIFDKLRELVPYATLHVTYDVQRVVDSMRWQASHMATLLLDCERRMKSTEGVTYLGAVSRAELVREQLECQVHVWPSDPPNVGSQIHGITQMECAAAGAALVLSDVEAFPEVFGGNAEILPVPGAFMAAAERRCTAQDWAEAIADAMTDPDIWRAASSQARTLAEANTWARVIDMWDRMLGELTGDDSPAPTRAVVEHA